MAAPGCAKCIKARPGQRVVRGPDWWGGSEDGGSDHVGTIISIYQPGTDSGYSTHPVEVHWDAGPLGYYRAGCSSKTCDLRLIDAGPAGVVFSDISCGYCETKGLVGTRWKCVKCADYNLCHSCYMGDKHNVEHEFLRYDDPASVGLPVQSRKQSTKVPFHGIYPGAEVQSHDGVKTGLVGNVRGKARLLRKAGGGNLGYNNTDKVDFSLKFQKAACGGDYYKDHMPAIALPGHDPMDVESFSSNPKTMSPGDGVQVIYEKEQLSRLQSTNPHTDVVTSTGVSREKINLTYPAVSSTEGSVKIRLQSGQYVKLDSVLAEKSDNVRKIYYNVKKSKPNKNQASHLASVLVFLSASFTAKAVVTIIKKDPASLVQRIADGWKTQWPTENVEKTWSTNAYCEATFRRNPAIKKVSISRMFSGNSFG